MFQSWVAVSVNSNVYRAARGMAIHHKRHSSDGGQLSRFYHGNACSRPNRFWCVFNSAAARAPDYMTQCVFILCLCYVLGSGNANYYYNTNLTYLFSTCSILISSLVSARKIFHDQKLIYLWIRDPRIAKYCNEKLMSPKELEIEYDALREAKNNEKNKRGDHGPERPCESASVEGSDARVDAESSDVHKRK